MEFTAFLEMGLDGWRPEMTSEKGLDILIIRVVGVFELVVGNVSRWEPMNEFEPSCGVERYRTRNCLGRPD